ncbi:hypothetical protein ABL78_1656 [Leptomonas seymouri]|uniref:Uncharacterized protein n=1 Tax=Leptomonas seymouri TaxID=5684 RepID=A0A0N1PFS7_LEPSE|nr:hypothetical protein ABL78_1656 [Leptomonas seymouri]|eukprot:KPI89233.1 hypothetical protein ABL78_1656 [Leptomonas seymouri]
MDSFGAYIDHLILLLAARFHAPLESPAEDARPPVRGSAERDPWELVSLTVQQSLCGPLTEEERLYMRHLDVHHFTASVCRERARYVVWKLSEDRKKSQAARRSAGALTQASSEANPTSGSATTSADPNVSTFDVTRDVLRPKISTLYALVSRSLPSTLGGDDEDVERSEENGSVMEAPFPTPTEATAASSPISVQVREVFVRTQEERRRDEQMARARDEFLSQIQELQSAYFEKYRRWMDVPANVLEPPPPTQQATVALSALSSRQSSVSVNGSEAATQKPVNGLSHNSKFSEEEERGALLEALKLTRAQRPAPQPVAPASTAVSSVRTGVHPTIAAMRRQVRLQRPLRPSAVPEDALEDSHRASEDSQTVRKGISYMGVVDKAAVKHAALPVVADAAATEGGAADGKPSTVPVNAASKETAPPVSRRGRWQILEYSDDDGKDE